MRRLAVQVGRSTLHRVSQKPPLQARAVALLRSLKIAEIDGPVTNFG